MKLCFPNMSYQSMVEQYINEFDNVPICGSGGFETMEYSKWIVYMEDLHFHRHVPKHLKPASTYFLIEDDRMIGTINIRHELNEYLFCYGGNIGYSVLPSERQKGHATYMLEFALEKCKELGMKRVLLTCLDTNIASQKVIQKCGGVLEDQRLELTTNKIYQRYWIQLKGDYND